MANPPLISVYIASHNYGAFLSDAIESVLRQVYSSWELLIIDDQSTDNTPEIMNLYQGDSRIRLFRTPGIGLPAVCNLALREAKGEYLIRLDGDDIFDEHILLVLSEHLRTNLDLALVFPDYFLMDDSGNILAQERRERVAESNHLMDMPANGACTMIRKSVLEKVGGYREDLGAQDGFDLWTKVQKEYKCANVNLPLFYYRRHSHNLTNNSMRILNARRQIKKDTILNSLSKYKPFTAVIPCRRNYDFAADVWQKKIGNKTLLEMDIESCLRSTVLDHVVVACDNPDVQDVMKKFSDSRLKFFQRQPEDTIRSRSLVPTLEKISAIYDPQMQGVTVLSYLQAPFVKTETLEEAIFTLIMNQTDSAVGVEEIKDPIYVRSSHGLSAVNSARGVKSDIGSVYREANTALATLNKNLRKGSLTGATIVNFQVIADECFFINSEKTLKIAQIIGEFH